MRKSAALLALGLASPLLGLWPSSQAHACSPIRCAPSMFLPVSGSVAGNAVEFLWAPPRDLDATPPTATPHLYKLVNGQRSEIPSEVLDGPDGFKRVRPTQAVPEGTELVLDSEEPACLSLTPEPAHVTVSAASAKPTKLGTIEAGALEATVLNIPTSRGSCTADFNVAKVELVLALDVSAQPFKDSLRHTLIIDGERRPQRAAGALFSDMFRLGGELEDVVYTLCGGRSDGWTRDLTPGSHRIQWLATLPDGSELRSDEVMVALECPADTPREDAGEQGQGVDATSEMDESSESASPDEESAPTARRVESSCALGAAPAGAATGTWLGGLALVLARRRRGAQRR